jgi:hypothetical protein
MKLLIKFPSRERPEQFAKVLDLYARNLNHPQEARFLLTFDDDDPAHAAYIESTTAILMALDIDYTITTGTSASKIAAINRDMDLGGQWDIMLLASDDMVPERKGYDTAMRKAYMDYGGDCAIWMNAGDQPRIATLCGMTRAYYQRFGYIYHPDYVSLWCDNEWTDVARSLNRLAYVEDVYIRNASPDWGGKVPVDKLYQRNNRHYHADQHTYTRRLAAGFP